MPERKINCVTGGTIFILYFTQLNQPKGELDIKPITPTHLYDDRQRYQLALSRSIVIFRNLQDLFVCVCHFQKLLFNSIYAAVFCYAGSSDLPAKEARMPQCSNKETNYSPSQVTLAYPSGKNSNPHHEPSPLVREILATPLDYIIR